MSLSGVHHSKLNDFWATPEDFFKKISERFSFALDACAEPWSAKCPRYYTPQADGLTSPWATWTWCNPPYSQLVRWCQKAAGERARGVSSVLLTFARTDTQAWHDYVMPHATELIFIKGRIRFVSPVTKKASAPAPTPSVLIVYDATVRAGSAPTVSAMAAVSATPAS